jgi:hypothetical protein
MAAVAEYRQLIQAYLLLSYIDSADLRSHLQRVFNRRSLPSVASSNE